MKKFGKIIGVGAVSAAVIAAGACLGKAIREVRDYYPDDMEDDELNGEYDPIYEALMRDKGLSGIGKPKFVDKLKKKAHEVHHMISRGMGVCNPSADMEKLQYCKYGLEIGCPMLRHATLDSGYPICPEVDSPFCPGKALEDAYTDECGCDCSCGGCGCHCQCGDDDDSDEYDDLLGADEGEDDEDQDWDGEPETWLEEDEDPDDACFDGEVDDDELLEDDEFEDTTDEEEYEAAELAEAEAGEVEEAETLAEDSADADETPEGDEPAGEFCPYGEKECMYPSDFEGEPKVCPAAETQDCLRSQKEHKEDT